MATFNDRLLEERKRLDLTQAEFAEKAGIVRETQLKYEKGTRTPSVDYLTAIALMDVDVQYLLTGIRTMKDFTQDELSLIDNYRQSTENGKKAIETTSIAVEKRPMKGMDKLKKA